MTYLAFDTLAFSKKLQEGQGFTQDQAENLAEAMAEQQAQLLNSELATKADIAEVRVEIAEVRSEITEVRAEITEVRSELKAEITEVKVGIHWMKWAMGIAVLLLLALLGVELAF